MLFEKFLRKFKQSRSNFYCSNISTVNVFFVDLNETNIAMDEDVFFSARNENKSIFLINPFICLLLDWTKHIMIHFRENLKEATLSNLQIIEGLRQREEDKTKS